MFDAAACHTGGCVVRSAGKLLRLRPLNTDCSLRLWQKALVHPAAPTAYHDDRLAKDYRRRLTGSLTTQGTYRRSQQAGTPSLYGDPACPPLNLSTASASTLTPHATVTASPFSGPIDYL